MRCSLEGNEVESILGSTANQIQRKRRSTDCNCDRITPSQEFVVDHTKTADTEIYVAEKDTGTIWVVDMDACQCRKVVDASQQTSDRMLGKYLLLV